MKTRAWAAMGLAATFGIGAGTRASAGETETFTATMIQNADMRQAFSRTWPMTFHVERWTSDEDGERLKGILKEGGPDALLREFQKGKTRAGYVVSPAFSREPSWRVAMATAVDTPRGRVVRLLTDRPIQFAEAYSQSRSLDYEFAAFEFTLDKKGSGQGIAIPAARLSQDEDGQVTVETLPYTTGPERLIGVRKWGSEKKGD
jgi:hypothetical protein